MRQSLQNVHCTLCNNKHEESSSQTNNYQSQQQQLHQQSNQLIAPYIGVIKTNFPEKRATPRQPGICGDSVAKLILNNDVFTNPEHSLEGLDEYSHMWILFHFHKNESNHVRAKVAPPRLNGLRTGVFATRSPHRPSPIGLSLVKIEQINERTIYFSGVDMVDATPVLDIKPYIPQYDNPGYSVVDLNDRLLDGRETDVGVGAGAAAATTTMMTVTAPVNQMSNVSLNDSSRSESRMGEREAPDGEEEEPAHSSSGVAVGSPAIHEVNTTTTAPTAATMMMTPPGEGHIRVPAWINDPPVSSLSVVFSERALAQLQELQGNHVRSLSYYRIRIRENVVNNMFYVLKASERQLIITSILREDPRSVYLRARWGNQYYTFRIAELHVSCKFDDVSHSVTVFQIRTADSVTDE